MFTIQITLKSASESNIILAQLISLGISTLAIAIGLATACASIDSGELRESCPWIHGYVPTYKDRIRHNMVLLSSTFWIWYFSHHMFPLQD